MPPTVLLCTDSRAQQVWEKNWQDLLACTGQRVALLEVGRAGRVLPGWGRCAVPSITRG